MMSSQFSNQQEKSRLLVGGLIALIVVILGLLALTTPGKMPDKKPVTSPNVQTDQMPASEQPQTQLKADWQIYKDDLEKYSLVFPPQTFLMYLPVKTADAGHTYGVFYSDEAAQACAQEVENSKNTTGAQCRQAKYFVTVGGSSLVAVTTDGAQSYTDAKSRIWKYVRVDEHDNTRIFAQMTQNTDSQKLQFEFIIPANSRVKDESEVIAKKTMDEMTD